MMCFSEDITLLLKVIDSYTYVVKKIENILAVKNDTLSRIWYRVTPTNLTLVVNCFLLVEINVIFTLNYK